MTDLHKALADIGDIRLRMAADTLFRGFGPPVLALTGGLALALAVAQSVWVAPDAVPEPLSFLGAWVGLAAVSAALIGATMLTRARRHHGGLADAMLRNAAEHFLPFGAAGAVVAAVLARFAPDATWTLPGLWSLFVGLGLFAALRFLPRAVALAGAWYFVAGAAVLILSSETRALSPWAMGVPFGTGQVLLAVILQTAFGDDDAEGP